MLDGKPVVGEGVLRVDCPGPVIVPRDREHHPENAVPAEQKHVVQLRHRKIRVPDEILENTEHRARGGLQILAACVLQSEDVALHSRSRILRLLSEKRVPVLKRVALLRVDERDVRKPGSETQRRKKVLYTVELELAQDVLLVIVAVLAGDYELHAGLMRENRMLRGILGKVEPDGRDVAVLFAPDSARLDFYRHDNRLSVGLV